MGEYSYETQVHLVLGILGLFNFIRQKEGVDLNEGLDLDEDIFDNLEGDLTPLPILSTEGTKAMNLFRDKIAQEMWVGYCEYIGKEL